MVVLGREFDYLQNQDERVYTYLRWSCTGAEGGGTKGKIISGRNGKGSSTYVYAQPESYEAKELFAEKTCRSW